MPCDACDSDRPTATHTLWYTDDTRDTVDVCAPCVREYRQNDPDVRSIT